MKKFSVFLCAIALVFGVAGMVQATPMYYTFTGNIYYLSQPGTTTYIEDRGFNLGDSVNYIVEIDFAANGSYTRYNTSVTSPVGNFYVDLVSGTVMSDSGYYSGATNIQEYNYGSGESFYTLSANNALQIYESTSANVPVSTWGVGQSVRGAQWIYDADATDYDGDGNTSEYVFSRMFANLTLTNISQTNPLAGAPVPEPATMLLFGSGLVGLVAIGRKKFFKK